MKNFLIFLITIFAFTLNARVNAQNIFNNESYVKDATGATAVYSEKFWSPELGVALNMRLLVFEDYKDNELYFMISGKTLEGRDCILLSQTRIDNEMLNDFTSWRLGYGWSIFQTKDFLIMVCNLEYENGDPAGVFCIEYPKSNFSLERGGNKLKGRYNPPTCYSEQPFLVEKVSPDF